MALLPTLFLLACSGDTASTSDTAGLIGGDTGSTVTGDTQHTGSTTDTADTQDTSPPPPTLLELIDQSVNQASAAWSTEAGALVLETREGTNDPGAFNGGGTGNKAIASVFGLDGQSLADFIGTSVDARPVEGSAHPYLNAILDLACDSEDLRVLVVDQSTWGEPTEVHEGWPRYTANAAADQWKCVGGLDDLLPTHLESSGGSLASVVAAYPSACLRDADTGDGGLPVATLTHALMIILGDSGTTAPNRWEVGQVTVDDRTWGPPAP